MFYDYVKLEDGTQIAYSQVLDDGTVEVSVERPVDLGFDSARYVLPSFERSEARGFSDVEIASLDAFIRSNAPLMLRLARNLLARGRVGG